MSLIRLTFDQKLPITIDQAWQFFSDPKNLAKITPDYLGFKIQDGYAEEEAYAGQIISYTLYPLLGIPMHWVTEITHVRKPFSFTDIQLIGPYSLWNHEHRFRSIEGGIEMIDIIDLKLPLGPLGKVIYAVKVRRDIERIFEYRKKKLGELFGILR